MKILYDYQAFELQRFGGVSRYFYELLLYLQSSPTTESELPIKYSENEYLSKLPAFQAQLRTKPDFYQKFIYGLDFRGKWTLYTLRNKMFPLLDRSIYNKRLSIETLKKGNFDVFHPTFFDTYFLDHLGNKPFVVTIYDMIHEKFPQYYRKSQVGNQKKLLAEKAHKIIAISESTKKDIIDIFGTAEDKIEVIYLGNSLTESVHPYDQTSLFALPEEYLLYVGNRGIYKNFYPFLEAILPILMANKNLHIVCTGERFTNDEMMQFDYHQLTGRIIHFAADDTLLSILYQKALAFVFPSLYEGFGLPVLEAFSCGCPVIMSNTSSLPEVGGEAAVYFDPANKLSMYEAVAEVVKNGLLRRQLTAKGYEQLKKFSWELTGNQTLSCYKNLL